MTSASDDLATLVRVAVSLAVVVVLAVLVARLARRVGTTGPGTGLRVVDRAGLSREAAVAVVEVAGRALVLGVTARGVTLLTELAPEELAAAAPVTAPVPPPSVLHPEDVERALVSVPARPVPRTAGSGAILDPRTWKQGLDALRDYTARR